MRSYTAGRVGAVALVTAVLGGGLTCTPPELAPLVPALLGIHTESREARGGGLVSVDVGVLPGDLPDTNMVGPATTVAWFSNRGEGGKREKRYDLKPRDQAEYDLVLSNDGSGRTKWTINEINRVTLARTPAHSGHLWACDPMDHSSLSRWVGFKDCPRAIEYDTYSLEGVNQRHPMIVFASNTEAALESENRMDPRAPIWISCTSGCCTLGR